MATQTVPAKLTFDEYLELERAATTKSEYRDYAAAMNEGMYPHVSVACQDLEFRDGYKDVILNPSLVVEILSPSTRAYDLSGRSCGERKNT